MKKGIHPEYKPATIVCSCGNRIDTRSTQEEIHVEICSVCHPFYTGRQKLVDTAGRVERFKRKYGDVSGDGEEADEAAEGGESTEAEADAADLEAGGEAAAEGSESADAPDPERQPQKIASSADAGEATGDADQAADEADEATDEAGAATDEG